MFIFKKKSDLRELLLNQSKQIGFVPTMGALHSGHLSLIEKSIKENELTVCSIFVNPTQFNDASDFTNYPVTIESDIEKLAQAQVDIVFLPTVDEMYPEGTEQATTYDLGYLDTILDGAHRPGHFNGVCNIVEKLLVAVEPNRLYLGEKDFQQCLVIKRLLNLMQSNIELITCPTRREPNGLAMSSRNERLSKGGREKASAIFYALHSIKEEMKKDRFESLQTRFIHYLSNNGFDTEYLLLADADTLQLLDSFDFSVKMVVLIATKFEGVRLIDNLRLN